MSTEFEIARDKLSAHRAFREALEERLRKTENELIRELQAACAHEDVQVRYAYHPHNGDDWEDHTCRICHKWWSK